MYSESEIIAKSWLVTEICNLLLLPDKLSVEKIFLIGSYAAGKQDEWSDLDFLIQLKSSNPWHKIVIPSWKRIQEIHAKLDNKRIHVIFGSEEAARSLHERHRNEKKDYSYRQIRLTGDTNAYSRSTNSPSN